MNVPYKLYYRLGFHPWEDAEEMTEFVASFDRLVATEETSDKPPFGRALDLGCGSGIWGRHLEKRGWTVTGIDYSRSALRRAQERADSNGSNLRLVEGDVGDLRGAGVGSGYRLLTDTGTFHGLDEAKRLAMGREIDAVASDDATLILLAWDPKRRGPFPRGVSQGEIQEAFPGWKVTNAGPTGYPPPPPLRATEDWYRLRRT